MKLGILLTLMATATAIPTVSSFQSWLASFQQPIKNLIDNPLRKSTIPQFILDTQHPWIIANRRKLERLPKAETFLCSVSDVDSGLTVGASENDLQIPSDLFDDLIIDNTRIGTDRPGWQNALERVTEMKRCTAVLPQVKTFAMRTYIHHGSYESYLMQAMEPTQPPPQLFSIFADVLETMTNLTTIYWEITDPNTLFFEEAFATRNLSLPSVKNLYPVPSSQYLVGMCPNLEVLEGGGRYDWYHGYRADRQDYKLMFVQSTVASPKLKRFAMIGGNDGWVPGHVEALVESMPQIESLGILGSLGRSFEYSGDDGADSGKLAAIMQIISTLQNLTHLDLGASYELSLGFDGGAWCGNAYFGKEGRAYGRQVHKEALEATERAGDIVLAHLPRLKSLTIGEREVNLTWSEDGVAKANWPWEGRIDDWVWEQDPEPEGEERFEYGEM